MEFGPRDYVFLLFYILFAVVAAVVMYSVGLRRWIGKLRHPKFRRQTMALWGLGIFGLLESAYWWNELKTIWAWPFSDIIPAPVAFLLFIWAVALILVYQRALRPVTVA